MSEFKGTPAPWVRAKSNPKIIMSGSFFDDSEGYLIVSVTGNDDSGFYADEAEAFANANLIVAAPDLLNALQEVLRVANRATDEFDMARAAIAKALGQ